ncbi:GntR family transcriptional regulator [Acrocarpospora macrocephala]|uniref:GntR family transcriptional regulator n=1 Tax=Acrocarpospora macrocephala TaxID=150177 RepID=A0A5M3WHZ7_9ACTN|nr:GntR family transcriptional regulator [Acrocarpospora macrocephala]GES08336.1 GntR family transcriptional regulator [Acrocarpospora macrocephala]
MTESPTTVSRGALRRTTVRDVAESAIREMILTGELSPQTRLNEVVIAEELGISRGPLREAIQRLASEGLLEIIPHKGAFVPAVEEKELRQLYELRIAVETYSARKACVSLPPAGRQVILQALEGAESALKGDAAYPADMDFHRSLVAMADNAALDQALREVNAKISIARRRSAREPARAREAYQEHVAIAEALLAGRAARVTKLLEAHLWRSFENAVALLLG